MLKVKEDHVSIVVLDCDFVFMRSRRGMDGRSSDWLSLGMERMYAVHQTGIEECEV